MVERKWHIRLGAAAELDFANILKWTSENFGARQSRVYRNTIVKAIGELAEGADVAGSKARDEITPGHRTLHVARQGRRARQVLMYRIAPNSTIEIVRILHDRMDLQRYVPLAPGQETEWRPAVPERRRKSGYANALWRRIGARRPMKMGTIRSPYGHDPPPTKRASRLIPTACDLARRLTGGCLTHFTEEIRGRGVKKTKIVRRIKNGFTEPYSPLQHVGVLCPW